MIVVCGTLIWIGCAAAAATGIDVTAVLLATTRIESEIDALCDAVCAGNEKAGSLRRAIFQAPNLTLEIDLRSRHVPFRGVVLYDDTAHITARLELDPVTCRVIDVDLSTSNTLYSAMIEVFGAEIAGSAAELEPIC